MSDPVTPEMVQMAKVGLTALIDEATGYQEVRPKDDLRRQAHRLALGDKPEPDPIFGDLQKVLPDKKRLNAVFVEWRPHARKEENRYRACMQLAKPNYGYIDAYAPEAALALYRLEVKLRNNPWPT